MAVTLILHGARPRSDGKATLPRVSFDAPRIVIGRGGTADLRLPDPSVSARHATLRQRGAEYVIVDEGSTNGTRVGPVSLGAHAPRVVRSGELVRFGRTWIEITLGAAPSSALGQPAARLAEMELFLSMLAEGGEDVRPSISVADGPDEGRAERLDLGQSMVLGRSTEADFSLGDAAASRRHVEVASRGDTVVVRDLGSKSGTMLGEVALGTSFVPWKRGVELVLGENRFVVGLPALDALAEIERSPDEKLDASSFDHESEGEVFDAPADPEPSLSSADDIGDDEDDDELSRPLPRKTRGSIWQAADVAVVFLALGVVSLSTVGYFVLLK